MRWPLPQDYLEAVQTPRSSFVDRELREGVAETTALGLPRCASGRFASVFCFQCQDRKVAVRCFLAHVPDLHQRYAAISKFILADDMPCTVPFEYLDEGIHVNGRWHPILKMEWVEGPTFGEFVRANFENTTTTGLLANYFKEMTLDLRRHGIAHGDLQHDNIIVSDEGLRLVDYDGMFVPELAGQMANELGHENYQHPQRRENNFGPYLDNFSAWVIYTSLLAVSREPKLWNEFNNSGDCLLLRRSDFADPNRSRAFIRLQQHHDQRVRQHAYVLRSCLEQGLEELPPLCTPSAAAETQQFHDGASGRRDHQLITVPDWLSSPEFMSHRSLSYIDSTSENQTEKASNEDGAERFDTGHSLPAVQAPPLITGMVNATRHVSCFLKLEGELLEPVKREVTKLLLPEEQMLLAVQLTETDPPGMDFSPGPVAFVLCFAVCLCAIANIQWALMLTVVLILLPFLAIPSASLSASLDTKLKPLLVLTDKRILLAESEKTEERGWEAISINEIDTVTLDRENHQLQLRFRNAGGLNIGSDLSLIMEIARKLSELSPAAHALI